MTGLLVGQLHDKPSDVIHSEGCFMPCAHCLAEDLATKAETARRATWAEAAAVLTKILGSERMQLRERRALARVEAEFLDRAKGKQAHHG